MDKYNLYQELSFEINIKKIARELKKLKSWYTIWDGKETEFIINEITRINDIFENDAPNWDKILNMSAFRTTLQTHIMTEYPEYQHEIHSLLKSYDLCNLIMKHSDINTKQNAKELFYYCPVLKWMKDIVSIYDDPENTDKINTILPIIKEDFQNKIIEHEDFKKFIKLFSTYAEKIRFILRLMYREERKLWAKGIERGIFYPLEEYVSNNIE